jgi:hypothetical protein
MGSLLEVHENVLMNRQASRQPSFGRLLVVPWLQQSDFVILPPNGRYLPSCGQGWDFPVSRMMRRQTAVDYLTQLLVTSSAFLVVPVCVLLGGRRSSGALIITGGAALAASIVFWIVLGGYSSVNNLLVAPPIVATVLSSATSILLLAGWTLAIHAAATSGKWLWVFLLVVAGYISILAVYVGLNPVLICLSDATLTHPPISAILCGEPNSLRQLLFDLVHVLGPLLTLIYGLLSARAGAGAIRPAVASSAGKHGSPPGLYISPINSAGLEEDTEPNVHEK